MPGLAITDLGNMFCAVEFYKASEGKIKPLLGTELILTTGPMDSRKIPDLYENHSLVLLARNYAGYQNLMKMSSLGWNEGFHFLPRVDETLFAKHCSDLVVIMAQKKGLVASLLKRGDREGALRFISEKKEQIDKGHLYLEIVDHGLAEDRELNEVFRALSKETSIPLIATNDTYYNRPEDSTAHEILMAIDEKMTVSDPRRPRFVSREFYFKSAAEMYERMKGFEDACERTLEVLDSCDVELTFDQLHLPEFDIPDGFNESSYLRKLCEEASPKRFSTFPKSHQERLDHELKVISDMGFPAYFLIVSDFIQAAKEKGIPVGPGRGSAAGSIVSYLLGITDIDPMEYELFFERFLNPNRISMPDIDIDFCVRRRDEVIQYVKDRYGAEKVAQIITFGTLKSKAVIKDVARVMEIPYDEANEISKSIPRDAKSLVEAIDSSAEMQRWKDQYENLFEVAVKLEGLPRHTGIHAAGVVIAPDDVSKFVPLAGYDDSICTQYDGGVLESQGLLKMDFLGLSTLTTIQDALDHIRANRNIELNLSEIPLDDRDTFETISRGFTSGLFQVDSPLFRRVIEEMQPNTFKDIIALVALGRPGPLESGMDKTFYRNRRNPEDAEVPHEKLRELLEETCGIMLYQEQVMNSAVILAGYDMAQADDLRSAIGKKKLEGIRKHGELFVAGAVKNGLKSAEAERIYAMIETFGRYGFNKSHSAAYGLICYQTAFLKTHYPAEFLAAALTDTLAKQDHTELVSTLALDCERLSVSIQAPRVNRPAYQFGVDGDSVTFGFGGVQEIGAKAVGAIERAAVDGAFLSLRDFCCRVDLFAVQKRVIENLIKVGAFDESPGNRAQKLAIVDSTMREAQEFQRNRKSGQKMLMESKGKIKDMPDSFDESISSSLVEQLVWEKELTGIYFSGHPLDEYRPFLDRACPNRCRDVLEIRDRESVVLGGMVSAFRRRVNKDGKDWITFRLTDYSQTIECVVFARQFERVTFKVLDDQVVVVSGTRGTSNFTQEPQILVEDMELLDNLHTSQRWNLELALKLDHSSIDKEMIRSLKVVAKRHIGQKHLKILYPCDGYKVEMDLPDHKIDGSLDCIREFDKALGEEKIGLLLRPPSRTFHGRRN
jgi:DNA polymerase III subunit alpha